MKDQNHTAEYGRAQAFPLMPASVPMPGGTPDSGYPAFVAHMAKPMSSVTENLLHAAVGIAGEAGELLDCVKKTWVYGKSLDIDNLVEEGGDILFYLQLLANHSGVSLDDMIAANVVKLKKRFPSSVGYTNEHAIARLDKRGSE